jgi:hypothetical protein
MIPRCEIWPKHSECFEADRYGKDFEGGINNIEHLKRSKKRQEGTFKEKGSISSK